MTEGVPGLALRGVAEERGRVGQALDVGSAGEVQVTAVRLALARERLLEVLVCLRTVKLRHVDLLCRSWSAPAPERRPGILILDPGSRPLDIGAPISDRWSDRPGTGHGIAGRNL